MRGKTVTNTTSITGTNFLVPDAAKVDVKIASASLSPSIYTNADQVKIGTDVKYATKNVYAASAIDDYAASIGVAIDPSSLQLLYVEDGKAKDVTKDATIKWDGTKGFSVDTNVNLAATHASDDDIDKAGTGTDEDTRYAGIDHALVILYAASTTNVNKNVYGENSMTDTIITRADNATYAAANKDTSLVAYDAPVQQDEQGGTIEDKSLTQTGDATAIAGIGTAIAAGFAGIVAAIRRRRR